MQVLSIAIVTVLILVGGIWIWRISSEKTKPAESQNTPVHTQSPQTNATPNLPAPVQENNSNRTNNGNISLPQ